MTLEPGLCPKCDGPALHTQQTESTLVSCSLCGDHQVENEAPQTPVQPTVELQPVGADCVMVSEPVLERTAPKSLPNENDTMELHPEALVFSLSEQLAARLPQTDRKQRENLIQRAFEFFLAFSLECGKSKIEIPSLVNPTKISAHLTLLQRKRLSKFAESQSCPEISVLSASLHLYLNENPGGP